MNGKVLMVFGLRMLVIFLAVMGMGACTPLMARKIIETPNRGVAHVKKVAAGMTKAGAKEAFGIETHQARIAVWVLECEGAGPPRGTVVMMHGLLRDSRQALPFAKAISAAGFRCLLVDLRGHGASTGKYQTFGVEESRDVIAVMDEAQKRGMIAGPVGAWGFSLGGATALQVAAKDSRVKAAVSVESFASMRDEVPRFGRILVPILGWQSDETYTEAVNLAGVKAGFDPDEADTVAAVKRIGFPVLIIHSDGDGLVPLEAGKKLAAAGAKGSELFVVSLGGHEQVEFDRGGGIRKKTVEWLAGHLK